MAQLYSPTSKSARLHTEIDAQVFEPPDKFSVNRLAEDFIISNEYNQRISSEQGTVQLALLYQASYSIFRKLPLKL